MGSPSNSSWSKYIKSQGKSHFTDDMTLYMTILKLTENLVKRIKFSYHRKKIIVFINKRITSNEKQSIYINITIKIKLKFIAMLPLKTVVNHSYIISQIKRLA